MLTFYVKLNVQYPTHDKSSYLVVTDFVAVNVGGGGEQILPYLEYEGDLLVLDATKDLPSSSARYWGPKDLLTEILNHEVMRREAEKPQVYFDGHNGIEQFTLRVMTEDGPAHMNVAVDGDHPLRDKLAILRNEEGICDTHIGNNLGVYWAELPPDAVSLECLVDGALSVFEGTVHELIEAAGSIDAACRELNTMATMATLSHGLVAEEEEPKSSSPAEHLDVDMFTELLNSIFASLVQSGCPTQDYAMVTGPPEPITEVQG